MPEGLNRPRTSAERPFHLPVLVFVTAVALSCSGCANFRACGRDDDWWGHDKKLHFMASAAIGAGATALASTQADTGESAAIGMTAALAAGVGKEWYDLNVKKSCWSWKDLAWDFIGASVGVSAAAWAVD